MKNPINNSLPRTHAAVRKPEALELALSHTARVGLSWRRACHSNFPQTNAASSTAKYKWIIICRPKRRVGNQTGLKLLYLVSECLFCRVIISAVEAGESFSVCGRVYEWMNVVACDCLLILKCLLQCVLYYLRCVGYCLSLCVFKTAYMKHWHL